MKEETRKLLANNSKETVVELKRMIMLAEAGRLPVFVAVYQLIPAAGGRPGHGVMAHVLGTRDSAFAVAGQLESVKLQILNGIPEADARHPGLEVVEQKTDNEGEDS